MPWTSRGSIKGPAGAPTVLVLPEQTVLPAPAADSEQLFAVDVGGVTSFRAQSPTGLVTDVQRDDTMICRNETGATIPKGSAVYLAGVSGGTYGLPAIRIPLVAPARANALTTMPTIGVTLQDIPSAGQGRVMRFGMLTGVNTAGLTVGGRLWVSTATAGALVATMPTDFVQRVGFVVRVGTTDGQILVDLRAMEASAEGTLLPSGGTTNQVLSKSSATNWATTWRALTAADVGALTQTDADARYHRAGARTVAYASTITIDPVAQPNAVDITATGDITSLGVSTTGATNRQRIEVAVLASGATRAVTVASGVRTSTGVGRGPYSPVSGQLFLGLFEYSALIAGWVLTAATVTAS